MRYNDLVIVARPDWVISDTHFGHGAILDYCPNRRDWCENLIEHDRIMAEAWNRHVQPGQTVLHLGDFAFGRPEHIAAYRRCLNGKITLVRGNHDRGMITMGLLGFDTVVSAAGVEDNGKRYIFRHNPMAFKKYESAAERLFHGHCHGNPPPADICDEVRPKLYDVGIDASRNCSPVAWSDLITRGPR